MVVELEFLNSGIRVHDEDMIYENGTLAYPNVGDKVMIDLKFYLVTLREFFYLKGASGIDLKISFWCEEV
ncbi:hypothetical protein NST28_11815 [Paenibacillus sp. FSL R10-2791]|uniref:hypothetical protein n=1 Tax=Paenibacillus TaxID=44249 RepID=UPI0004F6F049|nr:hypothetical protein [Paenibacillus odorifer]AIQ73906.1 hypothetical protein PODO_12005 [Paenibacillus odorifer]